MQSWNWRKLRGLREADLADRTERGEGKPDIGKIFSFERGKEDMGSRQDHQKTEPVSKKKEDVSDHNQNYWRTESRGSAIKKRDTRTRKELYVSRKEKRTHSIFEKIGR